MKNPQQSLMKIYPNFKAGDWVLSFNKNSGHRIDAWNRSEPQPDLMAITDVSDEEASVIDQIRIPKESSIEKRLSALEKAVFVKLDTPSEVSRNRA